MSKLKKALLMGVSYVLIAALAIGGTLAYLKDEDSAVNVMTLGNVSIRQNEKQRVDPSKNGVLTDADIEDFVQGKPLYPYVDVNLNGAMKDDYEEVTFPSGQTNKLFIGDNAIDKFVSVTNTGKSDAYVRTIIALEAPTNKIDISFNSTDWTMDKTASSYSIEVKGVKYDLFVCIYKSALKPNETTPYGFMQVILDGTATNEDAAAYGDTYDILVLSQAIQTAGFADAKTALDAGFGVVNAESAAEWFGGIKSPTFVPGNAVNVGSETTHEDFADLLAAGANIYLTESVTIANPENSRFTEFVVNGEIGIWGAEGATLTFGETTGLTGDGTLTVYSGSIDEKQELWVGGNVTLVFEGGEHSFAAFSASSNGKIVVNGGVLNCLGSYAGIMGITFAENGQLIVNGGKLNMYQPINLNQNRCDAAYVEFNGGTVELLNGIENLFVVRNVMDKDKLAGGVLRGSSVRISGGTFIAHYEVDSAGDATSFVRNGDAPSDGNKVLVSNADGYDCVVTGGTFYGSWQRADNQRYVNGNGGYSDGEFVENSIAGFVANGYKITGDATNGYIVSAN